MQSSYLPWIGYFDLIASVDEFIFYDDPPLWVGIEERQNEVIAALQDVLAA